MTRLREAWWLLGRRDSLSWPVFWASLIAGTVGCSSVSPSANTPMNASTPAIATVPPGKAPAIPSTSHEVPQIAAITISRRVRRRPEIRLSTANCSSTITAVLTANARPIVRVDTSAAWRAKPGKPASCWP